MEIYRFIQHVCLYTYLLCAYTIDKRAYKQIHTPYTISIIQSRSLIKYFNFLNEALFKIVSADPMRINFFFALVNATFSLCQSFSNSPIFPSELDRTREIITKSESFP